MNFKTAKMTVKSAAIAVGIGAAVALVAPAAANGPPGPPPISEMPAYAGYGPPPPPPVFWAPERVGRIVCIDCGAVLTAPLAPPALLAGD